METDMNIILYEKYAKIKKYHMGFKQRRFQEALVGSYFCVDGGKAAAGVTAILYTLISE